MNKKTAVLIIILAVFFVALIPLQVFVENKADAINTQLVLQQAADSAEYSSMMAVKSWLKVAVIAISILKVCTGILMILLGIILISRSMGKLAKAKKIPLEDHTSSE